MRWFFLYLLFVPSALFAQETAFVQELVSIYPEIKEKASEKRTTKHSDIQVLLNAIEAKGKHKVVNLGFSVQGRPIRYVKVGNGSTKVLLWSQMHGNEPTATMAIFDLINWLSTEKKLQQKIREKLSIFFIPMLNPDGTEHFQRRNALGIDLNRDARSLISPESQMLSELRDRINADFAFDLHDQNPYFGNPQTIKPATISFLAAFPNSHRVNTKVRKRAVQLIGSLNAAAQELIPGQVTRYEDSFIASAFDENFTDAGSSTILIESGRHYNDTEKQYVRQVNFVLLATAFEAIATRSYRNNSFSQYLELPISEQIGFDLMVRQATYRQGDKEYVIDIGIRRTEIPYSNYRSFHTNYYIAEKGDLTNCFAFQEINANGLMLWEGKTYPRIIDNANVLLSLHLDSLVRNGYTNFSLQQNIPTLRSNQYPVNIVKDTVPVEWPLALRSEPNFVLLKNGKVVSVVINGIYRTVR